VIAERPFLLDTSVLLPLIRGKELGLYIDTVHRLRERMNRQLICVVTHGEIWAIAEGRSWGEAKREALREMLGSLVTVDISDEAVVQAYVDVVKVAQRNPKGSQTNLGENDLWIAAAARAAGAVLLTTDRHFDQFHPIVVERIFVDPASRLVVDTPN